MASNDVTLLADKVSKARDVFCNYLTPSECDAYFVAQNYLKHYGPSHDDLMSGIVDGSQDGGLDSVYIFANSLCIRDDSSIRALGKRVQLDLFFMQVKDTKGFGEAAIDKLAVSLPQLLDFSRDESALAHRFNPRVIETTGRFLRAYRTLDMPALRIYVVFASLKAEHLHENTLQKAGVLRDALSGCFAASDPSIEFLDAARLSDLSRENPAFARELILAENPISTSTQGGYIAVVSLDEYRRFITDDAGGLESMLFDANVRDYEGDTPVNASIRDTLGRDEPDVDFWWLNNGVTIVANRVQPANKLLELESPQIVNGLQTSYEIFKRSRVESEAFTGRSVLVKVIQAEENSTRDRIIRATNSQTALGPSALRATDKVQRQIEEHLLSEGLHYERRRNLYKNRGVDLTTLVSIDQMGQAVLSAFVQAPHIARGEYTRIYEEDIYEKIFSIDHPIRLYLAAIRLQRTVDHFLRGQVETRGQVDNFIHHLVMTTAQSLSRKNQPSAGDIQAITSPPESLLRQMLRIVQEEFARAAQKERIVLFDRVSKDTNVTKALRERMKRYLLSTRSEV